MSLIFLVNKGCAIWLLAVSCWKTNMFFGCWIISHRMMLFILQWHWRLGLLLWQERPCNPLASIWAPHTQGSGSHEQETTLKQTATWIILFVRRSPIADKGGVISQSAEWGAIADSRRALSISVTHRSIRPLHGLDVMVESHICWFCLSNAMQQNSQLLWPCVECLSVSMIQLEMMSLCCSTTAATVLQADNSIINVKLRSIFH